MSTRRKVAVWSLVVVATLLTLLGSFTIWVKRQVLDNGEWKNASAQVVRNPQIRDALSVYLVNQLYQNVDVPAALSQRLPENLKPLAAPAAAALRQPAGQAVNFILQRPRIQTLWINASDTAHQKLINVLENKTGYGISTGSGVVTLDLHELVSQLGTEIGLPASALAKLPDKAGTITLMRSDQLSAVQNAVLVVKALSLWLMLLAFVLYGTAVYVARGARRTTLRSIGWGFVLVGLLDLVVRKVAGNYVIDTLTSAQYRGPVREAWLIATQILGEIGWAAVLYGVLVLVGVFLAGPTRPAVAIRRAISPVLNERAGVAWSIAGLAFLLLVLWGPTHALRTWWGILLIGGLLAAGVAALRRQTLAEAAEPYAMPDVRGLLRREPKKAGARSPAEEIARLRDLHDAGSITDAEFERAKELALTT